MPVVVTLLFTTLVVVEAATDTPPLATDVVGVFIGVVVVVTILVDVVELVDVVGTAEKPRLSSFNKNASLNPADVRFAVAVSGSKSAVPTKEPVMYDFADPSTKIALATSLVVPPTCRTHMNAPEVSSFNTYTSWPPDESKVVVPAPGSKSVETWK